MTIPIFAHIATFSYAIPIGCGLVRYRTLSRSLKIFLSCLVFIGVELIIEYIYGRMGRNNIFILHWGCLIETFLVAFSLLMDPILASSKKIIAFLICSFTVFWSYSYFLNTADGNINTPIVVTSRLLIIFISLRFLQRIFTRNIPYFKLPMFYIAAGNLIYSASSIFILGLGSELLRFNFHYFEIAWYVNWGLMLISNLIFAWGFLCNLQA